MTNTTDSTFQSITVQTSKGEIEGYKHHQLYMFKGVPYAKAKRFCQPEPVEAWDGVLDCTSFGYVCPLLSMGAPSRELLVPHRYWIMDEDCLNLNIWTPTLDANNLPVVVWLHGGGYEAGSAIEHQAYEGEELAKRNQCVVVSINHRLNILGYLDLSDYGKEFENSGNAGTEDIIAALRWIRENIARFGGNANNVTLFGQSGGGCKITALLQTPHADGLFHKALIMSGVIDSSVLHDAKGSGQPLVEALMEELHISTVQELQQVPFHDLAN